MPELVLYDGTIATISIISLYPNIQGGGPQLH